MSTTDELADAVAVFTSLRPRVFGIAYRMLGSAGEADDLVQEVWLRWQTCDRAAVVNPSAFLVVTGGGVTGGPTRKPAQR